MPRFNYELTIDKIEKFKAEGRGQGEYEDYKPWLTVRDFPSNGRCSREYGVKVNREYHFLSDLERYFFYITEWDDNVVNIREQYPIIDRSKTIEIAEMLGYTHPKSKKNNVNAVMTIDFLITYNNSQGQIKTVARSIKPLKELFDKRTLEKLTIEKYYCESIGLDWAVVTDQEIKRNLAINLQDLRDFQLQTYSIDEGVLAFIKNKIEQVDRRQKVTETIRTLCQEINVNEGTLLSGLKLLIVTKQIKVNLLVRLNFNLTWNNLLEV